MIGLLQQLENVKPAEVLVNPLVAETSEGYTRTKCNKCGFKHQFGKCPAAGKICNKCRKPNHFAKMCRSRGGQVKELAVEDIDADDSVLEVTGKGGPRIEMVKVNNQEVPMLLDTGSNCTIIDRKMWKGLGQPKLKKTKKVLRQFDGSPISMEGQCDVLLEFQGHFLPATVVVCNVSRRYGILGNDVLEYNANLKTVSEISTSNSKKLGCLKDFTAKLELIEGAKPSYFESRHLPLHVKAQISDVLRQQVNDGILEPVSGGSEWASPIVCIRKPSGKWRICGDYKIGVNSKLKSDCYLSPNLETVFSEMADTRFYTKIDLENAYLQVPLDSESQNITTISTPIGLFRYKRLPIGIKTASAIFQRAIESVLNPLGIKYLIIYLDDILIGANNVDELKLKINKVCQKLRNAGLSINHDKSEMNIVQEIGFLGHVISEGKIKPDKKLCDKLNNTPCPKNKKGLETFLGLCQYYAKFIKNYSDIVAPLNDLRKGDREFKWTKSAQESFEKVKVLLTSDPVLRAFDINKDSVLTSDASENAIGAILSQKGCPVVYISRKLTNAEKAYSNIEREALAVIWSVERCKQFLLGKRFSLCTDHKPLEYIFSPHKELPRVASSRIIRWAIKLMEYDFNKIHYPGKQIPHVDALGRLDFAEDDSTDTVKSVRSFKVTLYPLMF